MSVTFLCVSMVGFAPPSKPVTLVPFKGRCQIRSELLQLNVGVILSPSFWERFRKAGNLEIEGKIEPDSVALKAILDGELLLVLGLNDQGLSVVQHVLIDHLRANADDLSAETVQSCRSTVVIRDLLVDVTADTKAQAIREVLCDGKVGMQFLA